LRKNKKMHGGAKVKKTVLAVMMVVVSVLALAIAGCGGGGGGGVAASASTSKSVSLEAKTAKPGDASWGTNQVSTQPSQVVLGLIKMTNSSRSAVSPVAIVTLPEGVTLQAGSGRVVWSENGSDRSAVVPDSIATTNGTNLGFTLGSKSYGFLNFSVKVASNATSGLKTVTVTINGVPTTIKINVSGGAVCQAVTNPTCSAGTHLVAGANDSNNCPTAGSCVADVTQTANISVHAYYNGAEIRLSPVYVRSQSGNNDWGAEAPYTKAFPVGDQYWAECGVWAGHTSVATPTQANKITLTAAGASISCAYVDQTGGGGNGPAAPPVQ